MEECCCASDLLAYVVKAAVGSYLLQFPALKPDTSVPAQTSCPAFTNKKSVGYVHDNVSLPARRPRCFKTSVLVPSLV